MLVEDDAESVEVLLQLGEGVRRGLRAEPVFAAAVDGLDLPVGLRVSRGPVLLPGSEQG